jgi:hypothetical protein
MRDKANQSLQMAEVFLGGKYIFFYLYKLYYIWQSESFRGLFVQLCLLFIFLQIFHFLCKNSFYFPFVLFIEFFLTIIRRISCKVESKVHSRKLKMAGELR